MLVNRRDDLLTMPRPEFLATREEQTVLARLEHIENQLKGAETPIEASLQRRIRRLKGTLTWTLETEYHERLTTFDENLRGLDQAMAVLQEQYNQYVRSRQAATHSYVGYQTPISRLRARVSNSVEKVDLLMARQGHLLEGVAIRELVARRGRLENYRDKARFALADSYDRATQAQARRDEP
jgi:chromosome segregation ATPase